VFFGFHIFSRFAFGVAFFGFTNREERKEAFE
jgi:hypothetical protein